MSFTSILFGAAIASLIFFIGSKVRKKREVNTYRKVDTTAGYEEYKKHISKVDVTDLSTFSMTKIEVETDTKPFVVENVEISVVEVEADKQTSVVNVMDTLFEPKDEQTTITENQTGDLQENNSDELYKEDEINADVMAFLNELTEKETTNDVLPTAETNEGNFSQGAADKRTAEIETEDCSNEVPQYSTESDISIKETSYHEEPFLTNVIGTFVEAVIEEGEFEEPKSFEPTLLTTADWLNTEEEQSVYILRKHRELASHTIVDGEMGLQTWVCKIVGIEGDYLHISDGTARTWVNAEDFAERTIYPGYIAMLEVTRSQDGLHIETFSTLDSNEYVETEENGSYSNYDDYNYEENESYVTFSNASGY